MPAITRPYSWISHCACASTRSVRKCSRLCRSIFQYHCVYVDSGRSMRASSRATSFAGQPARTRRCCARRIVRPAPLRLGRRARGRPPGRCAPGCCACSASAAAPRRACRTASASANSARCTRSRGGAVPDPLARDEHRHAAVELQLHHLAGRRVLVPAQIAQEAARHALLARAVAVADARRALDVTRRCPCSRPARRSRGRAPGSRARGSPRPPGLVGRLVSATDATLTLVAARRSSGVVKLVSPANVEP